MEGARPCFEYRAFYPAERAYTRMFAQIEPGEVLVPSPLLTEDSQYVLLHFQLGPDGTLSSPQVPTGNMRDLAESGYTTHERIVASAARLEDLEGLLDHDVLLASLPREALREAVPARPAVVVKAEQWAQNRQDQDARNVTEWQARARTYQQVAVGNVNAANPQMLTGDVREGILSPLWLGEALLLARRVVAEGAVHVQGCWLDWPSLREQLTESVRDLLPSARLERVLPKSDSGQEHMLAALPVRLVPGSLPLDAERSPSLTGASLLVAWACVLVAAAVAVLLRGVVTLSERRGAFVSAVTHELRSPLTTLRMYAEMLAEGMVPDEDKRRTYLGTLRAEADRLGHLVENVLAYARLEKGRQRRHLEAVRLGALLERVQSRLADRARHAGMRLAVEAEPEALSLEVRADTSAVEQILFNLVDNACKYAASASEPVIHIEASRDGKSAVLAVRDHGPGISEKDARTIFLPFRKSARDAANSAPGVGLGLALSRRLARAMGGDLRADRCTGAGARFVLTLSLT